MPEERKMDTYNYIVESKKYAVKHLLAETENYQFLTLLNDKRPIFGITSKISGRRQFFNLLEINDDIWNAQAYAIPHLYFDNNKVVIVHPNPTRIIKGWNYLKEKSKTSKLSKQERIVLDQMNRVCENLDEMSNPILLIAKVKV